MTDPTNPQALATELNQRLQALQHFNISVRQNLEAAELLVPELNVTINHLRAVQIADNRLLSAGIVWQQHYEPGKGPADSDQVYLAVLKIPGGIGALLLDTEDLLAIERENPSDPALPARQFVPFDECPSYVKASILPRVPELLRQLFGSFGITES